jgi:hypothetical protein
MSHRIRLHILVAAAGYLAFCVPVRADADVLHLTCSLEGWFAATDIRPAPMHPLTYNPTFAIDLESGEASASDFPPFSESKKVEITKEEITITPGTPRDGSWTMIINRYSGHVSFSGTLLNSDEHLEGTCTKAPTAL